MLAEKDVIIVELQGRHVTGQTLKFNSHVFSSNKHQLLQTRQNLPLCLHISSNEFLPDTDTDV